jgi:hypothetical protein
MKKKIERLLFDFFIMQKRCYLSHLLFRNSVCLHLNMLAFCHYIFLVVVLWNDPEIRELKIENIQSFIFFLQQESCQDVEAVISFLKPQVLLFCHYELLFYGLLI